MGVFDPSSTTQDPADSRPACQSNPEGWDLDCGDLVDWLRSIRICVEECPLLQQCWQARNQLYPHRHPAGVIWAGVAYTDRGQPLDGQHALVEYARPGNVSRRRRAAA